MATQTFDLNPSDFFHVHIRFQVSVFMPSIQYSFPPWDYSAEALEICKQFTNLHTEYSDVIMSALEAAVIHGEPVNPPIWWLDPNDIVALSINDGKTKTF